jgi:hypothetical protein
MTNDPLIQSMSSLAQDEAGNTFQIFFANVTLANNCLVLAFSHTTGVSITSITDDNSVSWTAGPAATGGNATKDTRFYYLLNAAPTTKVTVVFSASIGNFDYDFVEFTGVATASAVDGTSTSSNAQTAPNVTSGSVTTTQAGDLILHYAHGTQDDRFWGQTASTGISAYSNFEFASASRRGVYALQYSLQAASGAINPQLTFGGITTPFNSVTMALKMSGAGTARPLGIRIVRVHVEDLYPYGSGDIQFPTTGNLIFGSTSSWPAIGCSWTGTTDSSSNTYSDGRADTTNSPQCWYAVNSAPSNAMTISMTWTGTNRTWFKFYDIIGATTSPFDTAVFATGTQSSSGADITNAPTVTPGSYNGLIIVMGGTPTGPSSGLYSPSGAYYGNSPYTGETDYGFMNNGDMSGHYYNPDMTQVSFNWHMNNPTLTQYNVNAILFKGVPLSSAARRMMMGMGD